jgi:hypothetical protein
MEYIFGVIFFFGSYHCCIIIIMCKMLRGVFVIRFWILCYCLVPCLCLFAFTFGFILSCLVFVIYDIHFLYIGVLYSTISSSTLVFLHFLFQYTLSVFLSISIMENQNQNQNQIYLYLYGRCLLLYMRPHLGKVYSLFRKFVFVERAE